MNIRDNELMSLLYWQIDLFVFKYCSGKTKIKLLFSQHLGETEKVNITENCLSPLIFLTLVYTLENLFIQLLLSRSDYCLIYTFLRLFYNFVQSKY